MGKREMRWLLWVKGCRGGVEVVAMGKKKR